MALEFEASPAPMKLIHQLGRTAGQLATGTEGGPKTHRAKTTRQAQTRMARSTPLGQSEAAGQRAHPAEETAHRPAAKTRACPPGEALRPAGDDLLE